jgi:hypothetical protein
MKQEEFKTARHNNITQEQADRMTFEQQRIIKLEQRIDVLEEQVLTCLKYVRKAAERERARMEQEILDKIPAAEA